MEDTVPVRVTPLINVSATGPVVADETAEPASNQPPRKMKRSQTMSAIPNRTEKWRREWDLNPRYGISVLTISSRAP